MDPKNGSRFTGFPNQAEAEEEPGLDLTRRFIAHPSATYFVRAGGDHLAGRGILRGDFLVVDRSRDPRDGDVVLVIVEDEFSARVWRCHGGRIALEVACPGMAPYAWGEGCEVFGVVTSVHRDLQRPG